MKKLAKEIKNCKDAQQTRKLLVQFGHKFFNMIRREEVFKNVGMCLFLLRSGLFLLPGYLLSDYDREIGFLTPMRGQDPNFVSTSPESVKDKTILIVDVVTDSGLTFKRSAEFLKKAGAKEVVVAAIFGTKKSARDLEDFEHIDKAFVFDTSNTQKNGFLIPDVKYDVGDLLTNALYKFPQMA